VKLLSLLQLLLLLLQQQLLLLLRRPLYRSLSASGDEMG
jgi:hypothetical protein